MWIVAVNINYYPYIKEFSDHSKAKVYYDKMLDDERKRGEHGKVWIAEVEIAASIQ